MNPLEAPEIALALEHRVLEGPARIRPGVYELPDVWRKGALMIEADDVVIDFQGAVITAGGDVTGRLDQLEGYGILIRNRRNVTIRNAVVRGYRYNIFVSGCENVRIENCDVSYSRSHRIWDRGAPRDEWVVLRNVNDWRTYGAGVWFERVRDGVIQNCRACSAQNGIVLVESDRCLITQNDCAFNSGWGLAFWQSCDNTIAWNRADFCDRPWAGVLGGDSAGLIVSGSSHRNFFVDNSLTHGGDGFFLTGTSEPTTEAWSQRRLMEGSCDDNVIAYNDGSWCPANSFEGTFAFRNVYYRNQANDSGYGFWLGFSCDSPVLDNDVRDNRVAGVAIEHGARNAIEGNRFLGNRQCGVHLYARQAQPHAECYPSRELEIRDNVIRDSRVAVDLTGSTDYYVGENTLERAPLPDGLESTKSPNPRHALEQFVASPAYQRLQAIMATRPEGFRTYAEEDGPRGWQWTDFDEFAPHNFRGDLAAVRRIDAGTLELYLFEPNATQISVPPWATLVRDSAEPRLARVEAIPADSAGGSVRVCEIVLRCTPSDSAPAQPREQRIRRTLANNVWQQRWFDWSHAAHDGGPLAWDDAAGWQALFAGPPVAETEAHDLGPGWFEQAPAPGVPARYYALRATTRVNLPGGPQRFCATFDDGLRLLIDGQLVYANWRRDRPRFADVTVDLPAGEHELAVEYCYENRYAVLRWYWAEP